MFFNTVMRLFLSHVRVFFFTWAIIFLCVARAEAKQQAVIISDIRVENEIGVENAGPIMTRWLTDSVNQVAPDVRVVVGGQAAESARLSPKDTAPSVARAAATSIDPTHILDGYVFLWNQKYGLVLRLIELSNAGRIRVERVWAQSSDDIPAKIEYLVRLLFSPPSRKESPQIPAAQPTGREPEMGESEVSPVAAWLLRKHPEMVYVPGGEFSMGNNDDSDADNMPVDPSRREGVSRFVLLAAEKPEHVVNVKPFLIDKYEVTNAEYKKFKPTHNFPPEKASHPVTGISWYDAQAYAVWAGKRLPTEQEWEKAARGTDGRKWPWGNIFRRGQCNLGTGTAPAGSFEGDKSAYGAYDMAGNVQEWTSSNFTAYPKNTWKNVNFDARKKVVRGSYYGGNDFLARCSMRFCALPGAPGVEPQGENYAFIGFRCAMDVD